MVQGAAPASLLDSHESERAPHVREFIETAVRLGDIIQATDPARAAQRNAAVAMAGNRTRVVPATEVVLQTWLQAFGAAAVLLRPDRYVAGAAAEEATLRTLLQRRLGGGLQA